MTKTIVPDRVETHLGRAVFILLTHRGPLREGRIEDVLGLDSASAILDKLTRRGCLAHVYGYYYPARDKRHLGGERVHDAA